MSAFAAAIGGPVEIQGRTFGVDDSMTALRFPESGNARYELRSVSVPVLVHAGMSDADVVEHIHTALSVWGDQVRCACVEDRHDSHEQ